MTEISPSPHLDRITLDRYRSALVELDEAAARLPGAPISDETIELAAKLFHVNADVLKSMWAVAAADELAGTPAGDGLTCGPAGDVTFDGVEAVRYIGGGVLVVTDPYGEQFHFTVTAACEPAGVRDFLADTIAKWIEAADRYHVLVERS